MRPFGTVSMNNSGLDILVISELDYIYFFSNAPPSVVSHLYYAASSDNLYLTAYERLAKGAHIDLNLSTFGPFLATHNRFLVYDHDQGSYRRIDALQAIANGGYPINRPERMRPALCSSTPNNDHAAA